MDDDMWNIYNDMEYDQDTEWICDDGHSHLFATYTEQTGDPCPYREEWYKEDDGE